jgi:hypothetical protein
MSGAVDKRNALEALAPGDRVCWSAGAGRSAWGTVTEVGEVRTRPGVNGPVFDGVTVTVDVPHYPTYDECGWPVSKPLTVTETFQHASDVEHAYTPPSEPPAAEREPEAGS